MQNRNHELVYSARKQLTHTLNLVLENLKRSFTYKDLSKATKVSPSLIAAMLNDDHIPTVDTLFKLADGLGFPYKLVITSNKGTRTAELIAIRATEFMSSTRYQELRTNLTYI